MFLLPNLAKFVALGGYLPALQMVFVHLHSTMSLLDKTGRAFLI